LGADLIFIVIAGALIYLLSKNFYDKQSSNPNGADVNRNFANSASKDSTNPKKSIKQSAYTPTTEEVGLIVALMSKLAKSDGKVCDLEHELILNSFDDLSSFFRDKNDVKEILQTIYEKESQSSNNIEDLAHQFFKLTTFDYKKRLNVLGFLFNLAFIDGVLNENEEEILKKISKTFRISQNDFDQLLESFKSFYKESENFTELSVDEASKILDLRESDTIEDVKRKYKKLVKENHPDIIMGKGLDDEFVKDATEKLQLINEAYEVLKKAHKRSLEKNKES
jgi:DnaJ like chaperone protein